ncbi:Ubiquitin-like modifier-activating enzyme atg7 [Thalictrum thalictroides]|uniref:Ubiquitin-like modifier-activating enzyme atg7 n=1 Tax=Thalictrum thalictroides TaxID=46969 RepID=A0A7J6UUA3_THATH|nr:Ubiquitin-like modifier-activating enzyme atg7 [Thalictrum thalictroides]
MRHGAGPLCFPPDLRNGAEDGLSVSMDNLSTQDTKERTLDQQCTVTRPGLAPIASSHAVELLVGILHHPDGICAPAEIATSSSSGSIEQPLGILPHQIRGSVSQFSQMTLVGHFSSSCTACCSAVCLSHGVVFVYNK